MSPATELDKTTMLMTQTSYSDYDKLCRLDVLGLADAPEHDHQIVHCEFKEQLQRSDQGWYETELLWKGSRLCLATNEKGSVRRLSSLIRRLDKKGLTPAYNAVI